MASPFFVGRQRLTVADYRLVGCWQGALAGDRFVYAEYASR
jgi:hypothetical protein